MLLQELYIPDRIKIDLESEDKEEVFEELVDHLLNVYQLDCRDQILEALQEREAKMSTGIKKGIAIPHGKTPAVEGIMGVLGVSRRGIEYQSLDGNPVYVLFLLLSSDKEANSHIRVLKKIAQLLEMTDFYDDILKAENPAQTYQTIKKYEEMLEALENTKE